MLDGEEKARYAYGKNGEVTNITGENTGITRTYDVAGRMSMESNSLNGRFLKFEYDMLGRKTKRTDHLGRITRYSYDSESRLTAVISPENRAVSFEYDQAGRRTKRVNPNGTWCEYNYTFGRLQKLAHKKNGGEVFMSYSYSYDKEGNITGIVSSVNNGASNRGEKILYSYDDKYRLVQALYLTCCPDTNNCHATNLLEEFSYDPAGNMIEYKKNGTITAMQYDADDKLMSDNEFNYAYDLAGKLRQKVRKTDNTVVEVHDYNWDNRTTKITAANKTYEYKYDTLGRRVWKGTTEGTENTEEISLFFDGDDAYQEYSASGERTAEYMFSGRIDEPLLVTKGGQEYTYHQNHLGTVMGLTGEDENLVNEYEYTAYGMMRQSVEGAEQPYTYTAREHVGDSGLYYYRSRVMRSGNGAFTRSDDAMDGVNWRGYVGGRPINRLDPWGYDIIILLSPESAVQSGHLAIAISQPDNSWVYYSKNGEGFPGGDLNQNIPFVNEENMLANNLIANRYELAFKINTGFGQDALMQTYANSHLNDSYNLLYNNCAHFVHDVLQAGGVVNTTAGLPQPNPYYAALGTIHNASHFKPGNGSEPPPGPPDPCDGTSCECGCENGVCNICEPTDPCELANCSCGCENGVCLPCDEPDPWTPPEPCYQQITCPNGAQHTAPCNMSVSDYCNNADQMCEYSCPDGSSHQVSCIMPYSSVCGIEIDPCSYCSCGCDGNDCLPCEDPNYPPDPVEPSDPTYIRFFKNHF